MEAFCRKIILVSTCARKETVDIDLLITSRNGDRKIMLWVGAVSNMGFQT